VIERNLLVANREGFNFREQTRTTPVLGQRGEHPVWNHDQIIRHNLVVLNRDAQVWGWFDMKDNRHWPAGNAAPETTAPKPDDIASAYIAKNSEGHPQGLTLEKLHLSFEHNIYFAAPGQGWFVWGPTWTRHKRYASLGEFQADLHIDSTGQALDPAFADISQLDFRLRTETMSHLKDSYPHDPVPGVILGVVQ
jgi:hypothetical protein